MKQHSLGYENFNPSFVMTENFFSEDPHPHVDEWEQMQAIQHDEVNLAVLRRRLPRVRDSIREILDTCSRGVQIAVENSDDLDLVPAYFDEELNLQSQDAFSFYKDIRLLLEQFFVLSNAKQVGVRLEPVSTDNCRLFHVDFVGLRLVSTYYGPGTEWIRNEHVNRIGLGKDDNSLILSPGAIIQRLNPGWVGLMKGERFFGNLGNGLAGS